MKFVLACLWICPVVAFASTQSLDLVVLAQQLFDDAFQSPANGFFCRDCAACSTAGCVATGVHSETARWSVVLVDWLVGNYGTSKNLRD